jgi:hypothetical protein
MTRIPHDSPELENWFAEAKKADVALAPGPGELEMLGARLGSAPLSSALLGTPAAKITASLLSVVLAGGAALTVIQSPEATQPVSSIEANTPAVPVEAPAVPSAPPNEPRGEIQAARAAPVTQPDVRRSSPVKTRTAAPAVVPHSTWIEVNDALSEGNVSAARGALEDFIASEDGVTKERAELALAQLELEGPRADHAKSTLRRLAQNGREPSIRTRAQTLLRGSK